MEENRLETKIFDSEILVVSFGTSYEESLENSIGFIEKKFYDYFGKDYIVERAFTSPTIIGIIKRKSGIAVNNVSEALEKAVKNNIKNIIIQPTHIMNGFDYENVVRTVRKYEHNFEKVCIGAPLLSSDEDFVKVSDAIANASKEYNDGKTAVCFVGHGSENEANKVYGILQETLNRKGYADCYIGTVEKPLSREDVLKMLKVHNYKRVVFCPLMVVAGDHAYNDIGGNGTGSWKTFFESQGYEVVCVKRGIGALSDIAGIYLQHTVNVIGTCK